MTARVRSAAELTADLRAVGVVAGDALMVHASLPKIGPGAGGPAGVIAAIDAAVGEAGGWMMVLGAEDDFDWVNQRPEAERAALLAQTPVFDPLTTPAQPDVGYLAEAMRRHPGSEVNDHPEGRFGARGAARAFLKDAPWDDYYGPGSPLERLCRAGGEVLRLGADPDTVTMLHYAEYLVDLPAKRRERRHRRVIGPNGPVIRTVECLDDSNGLVDLPGEDYFARILKAYLAAGRGRRGQVGGAASELIEAADLVDFAVDWMATNLREAAQALARQTA
jgi:aminoglycoside N3'-acetyltransferase